MSRTRQPDFAVHVYLVEHGYQMDVFHGGKQVGGECRDFGDNHAIPTLRDDLDVRLQRMISEWRAGK